jgi:hypothetical protein
MSTDVLILNTAVADFRSSEFKFVEKLVSPGGLAKCKSDYMPDYSQLQYKQWIAAAGLCGRSGNAAPLMQSGLKSRLASISAGRFDGLDVSRFFLILWLKQRRYVTQLSVRLSDHFYLRKR